MGSLLSLYFLHPITTWLANKTQRFNPRYKLTNPTKTTPSPFAFSFLSVILLHLHYTLQSPSPSVTIPRSHVTLSPLPLLLPPVPLLLCLLIPCHFPLFLCYSVFSYPVSPLLILCYYPRSHVTLSPSTLLLFLCSFVTLSSSYPVPPSLSCKECLPILSTGAFTLSKARPFKHAEHAFLAPWRRPSCPLNMPFLEIRVQVFDSKEVMIVKETDVMSLSKWFG